MSKEIRAVERQKKAPSEMVQVGESKFNCKNKETATLPLENSVVLGQLRKNKSRVWFINCQFCIR